MGLFWIPGLAAAWYYCSNNWWGGSPINLRCWCTGRGAVVQHYTSKDLRIWWGSNAIWRLGRAPPGHGCPGHLAAAPHLALRGRTGHPPLLVVVGGAPGCTGVYFIDQTSQVLTGLGECCAHIHQVPLWYGPEPRRYTAAMLLLLMELRGYNSHGAFATAEQ